MHRGFIFHGTPNLVLAGFLLTALPRWTRQEAASVWSVRALALLWLAGRAASFLAPAAGLALAAFFILSLTWIAAQRVWAAGDNRNHKVVLLLAAEVSPQWFPLLAPAAAILWILAFGLFLMAFGRRLFHESQAAAGD